MHGECHQTHAAVGVEVLDRLHEPDVAFLNQIGMRQTVAQKAAGNRNDKPQMRQDKLLRSH